MEQKYLTVKLTLSKVGENCYRSRIEQSPLGASKGSGFDFEINDADKQLIDGFIKRMPGNALRAQEVKTVGKRLYSLVFGGEVGIKFGECLALTKSGNPKPRMRLAISVVTEELLTVPWEYFHDNADFLLKRNHTIIRVIDELTEQRAPYWPMKRLLIAIANPGSQDPKNSIFTSFDAETHKRELEKRFPSESGTEILMPATKAELERKIRNGNFDAFYFLGHGTFSTSLEGQLILETKENTDDPLDASDLSQWLSSVDGDQTIRFVYLNSCSTSKTGTENVFAGVAQRLMLDGAIDSAVAMQTDVQQQAALDIALGFFDELLRGSAPEQALSLARLRADDEHSWGIPVIFSSIPGPEELERNRIAHLLSADIGKNSFAFILANFRMGVPVKNAGDTEYTLNPEVSYFYPGETFSVRDTRAAFDVLRLVSQIADPNLIELRTATNLEELQCTHWFLFGSKSNRIVEHLLKAYSPRFHFDYNPPEPEYQDCWMLRDLQMARSHPIKAPHKTKRGEYEDSEDVGVIEKLVEDNKVFFLLSGLGDRATRGCGWYLYQNWKELFQEFGNKSFGIILKFPAGLDFSAAHRISRKAGHAF